MLAAAVGKREADSALLANSVSSPSVAIGLSKGAYAVKQIVANIAGRADSIGVYLAVGISSRGFGRS